MTFVTQVCSGFKNTLHNESLQKEMAYQWLKGAGLSSLVFNSENSP